MKRGFTKMCTMFDYTLGGMKNNNFDGKNNFLERQYFWLMLCIAL